MLLNFRDFTYELPYNCLIITFNLSNTIRSHSYGGTYEFLVKHVLVVDYDLKKSTKNPEEKFIILNKFEFVEKERISQFDHNLKDKTVDYVEFKKGTVEINPYFTLRLDELEKTKSWILETNPRYKETKGNKEYLLLSYNQYANVSDLSIEKTILEEYQIHQKNLELAQSDEVISLLESAYKSEPSLQTKEVQAFMQIFKEEREKINREFLDLIGFSKK